MPSSKETRLRGHLGRGALLSLFLHAQVFVPLLVVIFIFAARDQAARLEEVDVAFRDATPEELPADLPSLEDLTRPPEPTTPDPDHRDDPQKKRKPQPKVAEKKPAPAPEPPKQKPEPEVAVPPPKPAEPEEPKPPPPPPQPKGHEKMVDIDNKDADEKPPPDAKYLAEKNHHTDVETRATDTNLDKAQKGSEGSSTPSEAHRDDKQIGDDKAKVAELENVKSALGKSAPAVTPHRNPELSSEEPPPELKPKSLLALRDAAPREHELTPETADPSLPHAPDGNVALPQNRSVRGPRSNPSRLSNGKRMKLALSSHDFEYLFGADAEAERRLAQKERSSKVGRFQKRLDRVKSALENFIPEVKPGNQDALNTRAAPFAAFIARMHQSIHKLWGFGVLEEWDERSSSNPYNDRNLLTTLELVLNSDGTISKVTVVRGSGNLDYDVAAIDVAYSAGPYPDPPREIRSKNGKIYIHWRFYRDERQCATSGVDYFILNNPPAGGDRGPVVGEEEAAPGGAGNAATGDATPGTPKPAAGAPTTPARPTTPATPTAPAVPPGVAELTPPRRLAHLGGEGGARGGRRAAKLRRLDEETAAAEETPSHQPGSSATGAAAPRGDDPVATAAARAWFEAFARGDVLAMLDHTVYPFRSTSDRAAARNRGELSTMLKALVDESEASGRALSEMKVYSAAALRGVIGRLPPGMEDGAGLLFALAQTKGSETLILMLQQKGADWKAVGLARR